MVNKTSIIIGAVVGVILVVIIALVLVFTLGKDGSAPSDCDHTQGKLCKDGRICGPDNQCQNCVEGQCPIGYLCNESKGTCYVHTDTRDELIQKYKLYCVDMKSSDGKTTKNVCFTDSTLNVPIYPLIGKDCETVGSASSYDLGPTNDNIIGNPAGNMSDDNKTWIPFDDSKMLYYQPNIYKNPVMCILSKDHHYICENDGTYVQDDKNISKEGKCECKDDTAGDKCQYSKDKTCNGHGTPQDDGTCTDCDKGYIGINCQYSDSKTCGGHGIAQPDGTCKDCDKGYSGKNCECSDEVICWGNGKITSSDPCMCQCNSGYVYTETQDPKSRDRTLYQCLDKTSDKCYANWTAIKTLDGHPDVYCDTFATTCGAATKKIDRPGFKTTLVRPKDGWFRYCDNTPR